MPAGLYPDASDAPFDFHNDQDFIVRATANDPLSDWISQGDWGSDPKCQIQGKGTVVAQIPLPYDWTSASDCDGPADNSSSNCRSKADQMNNNAMALLLPDNVTLVQMQPAYRCGFGTPLLARWGNSTDGCPQQFPNVTSVLGDGTLGAHGGSGLSSMGGSIRLGELLPGAPPIAHALKLELNNKWYYGQKQLNPPTPYNGGRTQYVWPATGSNAGFPTTAYTGTNPAVAPGALLALPADVAAGIQTTTVIGGKIKQALTDYGGYIVDGTGPQDLPPSRQSTAICMESAVNAEMRRTFGYAMTYPDGVQASGPGAALYQDLLALFRGLHAVTNNGPGSVGGGGTPRQPTKAPVCGEV